jgi:hypothetical protein
MPTPDEEGRRYESLPIILTREEAAQLAFASRQMRNKYAKLAESNHAKGWTPEKGKRDANTYKRDLFQYLQQLMEKRLEETR